MKKNAIFGLLVISLAFSFIGCDGNDDSENGSNGLENFTITFELEGGNINGNTSPVEIKVKSGEIISDLPDPIKTYYELNGWFSEKKMVSVLSLQLLQK